MKELFKYNLVGVKFADEPVGAVSQDLYCTAIARSVKKGKKVVIDCRRHKCAGGNYFVGGEEVAESDVADVYVNKEFVMRDGEAVKKFLGTVGRNPKKSRYIVFEPGNVDADVVIGVTTAENVGRIVGLLAYDGMFGVDVVPAISTCSALFRPLVEKNKVHLNFVDYFDRKYQCKGFYGSNEIVVSMNGDLFKRLKMVYKKSSHGKMKPKGVSVYRVDSL